MAESPSPSSGRPTSNAAFSEIIKNVARRNEEAQKAARKLRAARDRELARRRRSDRH